MSEIEKMQKYIERTKMKECPTSPYSICTKEMDAAYQEMGSNPFGIICLIFEYGKAKGYRAAKAERKRVVS